MRSDRKPSARATLRKHVQRILTDVQNTRRLPESPEGVAPLLADLEQCVVILMELLTERPAGCAQLSLVTSDELQS